MNTVTINFIPCTPAPANGYKLTWRVAGSGDPYTDAGFFTESPAMFTDEISPEGTCYEGFLQSDCSESGESGEVVGNSIPWATPCEAESGRRCVVGPPRRGENAAAAKASTRGDGQPVRAARLSRRRSADRPQAGCR